MSDYEMMQLALRGIKLAPESSMAASADEDRCALERLVARARRKLGKRR